MLKKRAAVAAFSFLKKRLRRITLKVTGAIAEQAVASSTVWQFS
jgi:hypothetical protein